MLPRNKSPHSIRKKWYIRDPRVVIGGVAVIALVFVAIFAEWIAPHSTSQQDLINTLAPPGSDGYLFGTDELGRDLFSRVLAGARVSLLVGAVTAAASVLIGVPLGLLSGYIGGRTDAVLGRIFDIVLGVPSILLALGLAAVFGPSLQVIVASLGLVWWASYARIVRGEALTLAQTPFVEAAHASGCTNRRILFRYLLPNVLPLILALAPLTVASGILVEAALSYLGIGIRPPTPSWGGMLSVGRNYVRVAWWLSVFPGIAIVITILALNLLADGLRDRFDPTLRGR